MATIATEYSNLSTEGLRNAMAYMDNIQEITHISMETLNRTELFSLAQEMDDNGILDEINLIIEESGE